MISGDLLSACRFVFIGVHGYGMVTVPVKVTDLVRIRIIWKITIIIIHNLAVEKCLRISLNRIHFTWSSYFEHPPCSRTYEHPTKRCAVIDDHVTSLIYSERLCIVFECFWGRDIAREEGCVLSLVHDIKVLGPYYVISEMRMSLRYTQSLESILPTRVHVPRPN